MFTTRSEHKSSSARSIERKTRTDTAAEDISLVLQRSLMRKTLEAYKKPELVARCRLAGLDTSGTRETLIGRLVNDEFSVALGSAVGDLESELTPLKKNKTAGVEGFSLRPLIPHCMPFGNIIYDVLHCKLWVGIAC